MTTAIKPPFSLETALKKDEGLMHTHDASINEQAIDENQRMLFQEDIAAKSVI